MSNTYRLVSSSPILWIYEAILENCARDDATFERMCTRQLMPSTRERIAFRADVQTWRNNHPEEEQS